MSPVNLLYVTTEPSVNKTNKTANIMGTTTVLYLGGGEWSKATRW